MERVQNDKNIKKMVVLYIFEILRVFPKSSLFFDQVIVINLTSNGKGKISCKIDLRGAHPTASSSIEDGVLVMKGQAPALAVRRTIERISKE